MAARRFVLPVVWAVAVVASGLPGLGAGTQPALAAEASGGEYSLQWIPEDAAIYCAMLRNREQVEIIGRSKAWGKLKAMPAVEQAMARFREEAEREGMLERIEAAQKNPQVIAALETLADMLGDEIFLYGGGDWVNSLDLLQQLIATLRYGAILSDLSGSEDLEEDQVRRVLTLAAENLDSIKVPTTIIGFKIEKTVRMQQQLDVLAGLVSLATIAVPELANRFTREQVGHSSLLTLTLDGAMLPWDEIPVDELRQLEAHPGDADKVVHRLKDLKLVLAVGLRQNYLLVAIGDSTEVIETLGQGTPLVDRPEFARFRQHADQRICGVSYVSKPMYQQLASSKRDIDDLLELLDAALPHTGLSDAEQAQIRRDATAAAADLKSVLPEPGATVSFSFITERGIESYAENWGEQLYLDGSRPLELLRHTGGNPILAVVWRETYRPDIYDGLVRWLKVGYGYFEKYALPEMSPSQREQYDEITGKLFPLLERANQVTREMFLPALRDSQSGLVIDGKLRVQRLCREVPPLAEPMPMVEPALVMTATDAELLREACREYREIINQMIDVAHEAAPYDIPDFEIPAPEAKKTPQGELFLYRLPKEWGVDRKIVPNFGLSDHVAVVSTSRRHTMRLLKETPLAARGVLAEPQRPRAVALVFDWPELVKAATPWIELAAREIIRHETDLEPDGPQAATIMDQVHTVLEVLQVIRTCTLESYFENGALVTHSLLEIRDLP